MIWFNELSESKVEHLIDEHTFDSFIKRTGTDKSISEFAHNINMNNDHIGYIACVNIKDRDYAIYIHLFNDSMHGNLKNRIYGLFCSNYLGLPINAMYNKIEKGED